jgi:hypothetical protein
MSPHPSPSESRKVSTSRQYTTALFHHRSPVRAVLTRPAPAAPRSPNTSTNRHWSSRPALTWCSARPSTPRSAMAASAAVISPRSDDTSTGPRTSSGRTCSAAASNWAGSSRFHDSSEENTLERHWSWATASARSSSSSQLRWTWTWTGLPSPPASRNRAMTARRTSRGWLMVMRPSAHVPTIPAVRALTAAPTRSGTRSGRLQSRARSTRTSPSWVTSSPARRARITSTHSSRRASRVGLSGHRSPVTCSLSASPEPSAAQNRPGNISPSVAMAWAVITGWYRCPGAVTTPIGNEVAASAAPNHVQACPEWPWRSLHGARWSEHMPAGSRRPRRGAAQPAGRSGPAARGRRGTRPWPSGPRCPTRPGAKRTGRSGAPVSSEQHLCPGRGPSRPGSTVWGVRGAS